MDNRHFTMDVMVCVIVTLTEIPCGQLIIRLPKLHHGRSLGRHGYVRSPWIPEVAMDTSWEFLRLPRHWVKGETGKMANTNPDKENKDI